MTRSVIIISKLLAVAGVLLFLYFAISTTHAFYSVLLNWKAGLDLSLAVGIYIQVTVFGALAWLTLLKSIGQQLSAFASIKIIFLSQVAKYIPGNVAHHVGRLVLAKRHGLALEATLFTIFIETVLVMATAATLALFAVWFTSARVFGKTPHVPEWWVLAGLVGGSLLAPLVGHRLFERVSHWWAGRRGIELQSVPMPSVQTFCLVGLFYMVNYLILGGVLQIIASNIFGAEKEGILLLSGVFAVAWIAGFITPGAPAGIGVREVVLVAALTPVYGHQTAIGIAAVLRVVTVLGDGLAFLIGLGLGRLERLLEA